MSYFIIKTREKTRTENGREFLYNRKADKLPNIIDFFTKRVIENDGLQNAEAGLYTWILRESGNIFASKTLTKQEIGTLHVNLDMLTKQKDNTNIYAAGELEVIKENNSPVTIIFNLLSGSYMVKKFDKLSNADKLILRNQIVTVVENKLSSLGISSQFLECSVLSCSKEELIGGMKLIENANIRTPDTNLSKLNLMFNRKGGKRTFKNLKKRYKKTRKMRV
jgi:hypothetical protein